MTKNEIHSRASKIWNTEVVVAQNYPEPPFWTIRKFYDTESHRLDSNGKVICHEACKALEAFAFPPPKPEQLGLNDLLEGLTQRDLVALLNWMFYQHCDVTRLAVELWRQYSCLALEPVKQFCKYCSLGSHRSDQCKKERYCEYCGSPDHLSDKHEYCKQQYL